MAGMWTTLTWPPVKPKSDKPWGRPRKYKPKDIYNLALEYFEQCDNTEIRVDKDWNSIKKPKTIGGLCVYMEVGRHYLLESLTKEEYRGVVDFIKTQIENDIEIGMLTWMLNPTSGIFHLKNHFGQADKIENKDTVDNNVTITFKD